MNKERTTLLDHINPTPREKELLAEYNKALDQIYALSQRLTDAERLIRDTLDVPLDDTKLAVGWSSGSSWLDRRKRFLEVK